VLSQPDIACATDKYRGRRLTGTQLWATVGSFGVHMKALFVAVCLIALSSFASSQAAVEGALTHALSGATSATAGKALGQIGNQLAGKVGQQTSNVVSPRVTTVRPGVQKVAKTPQPAVPATPSTNTGSLIASIEGGEAPTAKSCGMQDKATPQQKADCNAKPTNAADSHPSEITLPAPK